MKYFPDTSFLCALYREQTNSPEARTFYQGMEEVLGISPAVGFEFRQSIHLQSFLHSKDPTKGFGKTEGERMLEKFKSNISAGAVEIIACDWPSVFRIANRISDRHTISSGNRSWDVLHVATALERGSRAFLSFDARQRDLAAANSLEIIP